MEKLTAKNNLLMQAYAADAFRKDAQQMLELIAAKLEKIQTEKNIKTIDRKPPQEQLAFWRQELAAPTACSLSELAQKIMQRSIRFHSKGYLRH